MTEHLCNLAVEHCTECTAAQHDSGERPTRPLRISQDGREADTETPTTAPVRGFTATPVGRVFGGAKQASRGWRR